MPSRSGFSMNECRSIVFSTTPTISENEILFFKNESTAISFAAFSAAGIVPPRLPVDQRYSDQDIAETIAAVRKVWLAQERR